MHTYLQSEHQYVNLLSNPQTLCVLSQTVPEMVNERVPRVPRGKTSGRPSDMSLWYSGSLFCNLLIVFISPLSILYVFIIFGNLF